MTQARPLDLICLGRAAVDLYGEQLGSSLESVQSFAKSLGGCAANIAVGAARQGLRVAMLTRVGDEQMGRFVLDALRAEGIDVSRVGVDPERLTGLVLLSIRGADDFPLLFYRENCADMALSPHDFDADFVGSARALLLTGTHFSAPGVEAASRAALAHARGRGTRVALDLDYRPVLWGLAGNRAGAERFVPTPRLAEVFEDVLPRCDLVVGTEDEVRAAGGSTDTRAALSALRARTDAVLVLKRGAGGCEVYPGPVTEQDGLRCPPLPVDVYNVLGAGDAFMAGFVRGWLEGEDWTRCGTLGNGAGALVVGRHACAPAMPTREELDAFVRPAAASAPVPVEECPDLTRMHRTTLREPPPDELCVLALDHRSHFERLFERTVRPKGEIARLKAWIAQGGLRGAERTGVHKLGMIIDAEGGRDALFSMTARPEVWLARPIERPDFVPLAFEGGLENVDARLRTWPQRHVVKCLVQFHPDGNLELREGQEKRLRWLQDACVRLDRALLLEVLPMRSARPEPDLEAVPRALARLYAAGLYPDWWKLPPLPGAGGWRAVEAVIDAHDPRCQGALVLGLDAPPAALAEGFRHARGACRHVRGFAVGRTIFSAAAERWARGEVDGSGVVEDVARRFAAVVTAWREAAR